MVMTGAIYTQRIHVTHNGKVRSVPLTKFRQNLVFGVEMH
jgi:hypothetical protein